MRRYANEKRLLLKVAYSVDSLINTFMDNNSNPIEKFENTIEVSSNEFLSERYHFGTELTQIIYQMFSCFTYR